MMFYHHAVCSFTFTNFVYSIVCDQPYQFSVFFRVFESLLKFRFELCTIMVSIRCDCVSAELLFTGPAVLPRSA